MINSKEIHDAVVSIFARGEIFPVGLTAYVKIREIKSIYTQYNRLLDPSIGHVPHSRIKKGRCWVK